MRFLVRWLDRLLRRKHGVYEFTDDPECILRVQLTEAHHDLPLPDGPVLKGEAVLGLHLWNEHVEPLPARGPDLTWALQLKRRFVYSLRGAAREVARDVRLSGIRAAGFTTGVLVPGEASTGLRVMERLGFVPVPYRHRLRGFGEFWENLYSRWLIWAFNPPSLRYHRFSAMGRTEMWMPVAELLRRYGPER